MAVPLALPSAGGTAPADRRSAFPLAVVAIGLALTTLTAGLVAAYLTLRSGAAEWPPEDASRDTYTAVTLAVTMILGMVTIEWAAFSIRRRERGQSLAAMAITLGFAIAFINGLYYLITQIEAGVGDSAYFTVVHALLVVPFLAGLLALIFVLVTLVRNAGHQLSEANYWLMRGTANFWHIAAVMYIAAYYTIFITK
ncbi:MAG: hypothetical protein AVDCRST_MAG50-1547 [uncultured Acidimicrobiales bacterium]|uniref:Cytochrome aa3 subunit 3 n=1 Tax=uncultured Acidimicrobiales bacterium TaxID=310071 RepID=A0A6J4I2P5_9ACTN|nr:MAG: hypothetical protein AVDCRST_MAG50-1547 [uncultured Acidimicrobiales bacterium]